MNKIIVVVATFLAMNATFAQKIKEKEVPNLVLENFKKMYPNAKEVEWEKEDGNFEVNFDLNEIDNSVLFDEKGTILETELEIELNLLPVGVMEYIKSNYVGKKVKEASKITDAKGAVTYEVEIKGKDLLFDKEGKFIKEVND